MSSFARAGQAAAAPAARPRREAPAGAGSGARGQRRHAVPAGQNPNGMHIYIRAGLKSHGAGPARLPAVPRRLEQDPDRARRRRRRLAALRRPPPSSRTTDVVVMYKGDAGYMTDEEKARPRGVRQARRRPRHASTTRCAVPIRRTTPTIVGGAKKHGETNFTLGRDRRTRSSTRRIRS